MKGNLEQNEYNAQARLHIEKALRLMDDGKAKEGNMNFGYALEALKKGKKIRRKGWSGRKEEACMKLQRPDKKSKMTQAYIYCEYTEDGKVRRVPWMPLQTDILAEDWEVQE